MRKALIVTDKALVAAGALKRVTDLLEQLQLAWAVYDKVVPNPTIRRVQGIRCYLHRHRRWFTAGHQQSWSALL